MMQSNQFTLAVCENFLPEAKAVLAQNALHDVNLVTWKPCCEHPPKSWNELATLVDVQDKNPLLIVGACFSKMLQEPPSHLSHIHLHSLEQCFHLLCDRTQVNTLIKEGSYIVSPAWVVDWQDHLDQWGFNQETAQIFFNDTAKKIVLLDTGIMDLARLKTEEFASYVGLPCSKIDIGLNFISQYLQSLILKWQNSYLKKSLATSQENTANQAMALALLDGLTDKTSEDEAIKGVVELFRTLFAPKHINFFHDNKNTTDKTKQNTKAENLSIDYRQALKTETFLIHESRDGFCVALKTQDSVMGYLDVGQISFSSYLNRYLNLAISIAPLCAMAINKALISQKRKEEVVKLARTSNELSEAQRIANLGSWDLDLTNNNLSWSNEVYRIFGLIPQQFPASYEGFLDNIHPEDRDRVNQAYTESLENKQPYTITYRLLLADGTLKYVNERCETHYDADGNPVRSIGTVQDITERVLAEQEHQKLEDQLRQKHKMEAVGYMAGGMAHNFNNNLSIILGNVELSQMKQAPGSEAIPLLENAKIAVHRSRDLVQKIITYSRKGIRNTAPIHLTVIIDETIDLLNSTLPTTVTLQKNFAPNCVDKLINADASQIQEVLINLCNNAIHAMDEKGVLTISLKEVELEQKDISVQYDCPAGCYAKLSVQDSGCGMSAEILDKIFDPFFSTKEEYEGAGIGLSTVQGIVAQHGGMITVKSAPDQGTTFDLFFPLIELSENIEAEEVNVEHSSLPRGTELILFVDDDEMLASLGENLLNTLGYQISMMTDSNEALKMFTANADRFDLVITDQTMPGLTGKELIAEIKKVRPDIPTILCTGYSSKIDEEESARLGISAFMMKPLDLPVLSQTVRQVLDENKRN